MVATPGNEEPPLQRRGEPGRRRRRRRESALVWWALFGAWAALSWWLWSWRMALLGLLGWCLYQLMLVPTLCRVRTRQGFSCRERARGRLFACRDEHQQVKNDALWRLVGMRNRFRRKAAPDPNRETGQVLVSPAVRGRLAQVDRLLILLAAAGTLVTVAGMVYGYAA
ncbi:hypothetical protein [Actinomadura rugatobispora]|uniref:Uncharacterized protein n=1 Tax=Actinomadura rugatobispora TaxID=1994 RepID=A0ABW0ZTZ4_9ACTN|nr:hypothetical protein GCM10010200_050910 [Actinomadura rugatobispora]